MSGNNSLILKNTMFMYARMFVLLIVSLFTARIVFNTLGVEGYGTYNLVAGIIVFFTFLNSALGAATKRFVTAQIAQGDQQSVRHVFNVCMVAHVIIALIVFVLAESVGLWFVTHKLNIPPDLMQGAMWVYQLSVLTAIVSILQSPYSAAMIAYEKMGIYAVFTISDVIFKLIVIYTVQAIGGDKLTIYALLLFGVSICNALAYQIYARLKLPACRLQLVRDKALLREIFSFTSWSLMGQGAVVATNQGVGVLINLFYSVSMNAAMGISSTISTTVNGFVSNFQTAFNPQIIKSYNSADYARLQSLLIWTSKLSSYLIIVFLVPLLFETSNVLTLWLGDYPEFAVEFTVLSLVCIYIESIAAPLWMMIYSQSKIKTYQMVVSAIYIMSFFGAWIALALGAQPYMVIVVRAVVFVGLLVARLMYVKRLFLEFNVKSWINNVLLRGGVIISLASLPTWFVSSELSLGPLYHIVVVSLVSLVCTVPLIYFVGMNRAEREFVHGKLRKQLKK